MFVLVKGGVHPLLVKGELVSYVVVLALLEQDLELLEETRSAWMMMFCVCSSEGLLIRTR